MHIYQVGIMAGKRKIGATIALDGEKQFTSAVTTINKEISTMKSSMGLLKEQTAGQANSLETLRKKHDVLDSTLTKYREKQDKIREGLENSQSRFEKCTKEVAEYKEQLDRAEKSLDEMKKSGSATTEEIEEQEKAVQKMRDAHQANLLVQEKAKQGVEEWKNKLNTAESQVLKANKALEQNDKYLAEAEKSSDGCATSIDGFGKKTNTTTQRLTDMNRAINTFAGGQLLAEYFSKASEAMRKLSEKAYSAAMELDEGYDTIVTKTGATGDALKELQGVADDVFGEMPLDMETVGQAVGEVNTRFKLAGDELKNVSEDFLQFAKINNTDVSNSVDSTDRIMKTFKIDTKKTGDVLGLFTKIGQDTGMTMDSLMGTIDKNGATFRELGFSLEDSAQMLAELEKNGVDTSGVLTALRKEVVKASKEGKSAETMLSDVAGAIMNAGSETEALQIATEAFGTKGALVMTEGLRSGRISLGNTSDSMKKYGDVVKKTFEETLSPWDEAKVAMNNLKAAGSDLAGEAFRVMQPAIEGLTDVIKGARDIFDSLPEPIQKVVATGGALFTAVGVAAPKVAELAANIKMITAAQGAANLVTEAGTVALEGATVAQVGFNAALSACGVGLVVAGVVGLVAWLETMAAKAEHEQNGLQDLISDLDNAAEGAHAARDSMEEAGDALTETFDTAKASIDDAVASSRLADRLSDELIRLNSQTSRTAEEQARMESIVSQLNTIYPELELSIDKTTGSLNKSNEEITRYIENAKQMSMVKAYQEAYAEVMDQVVEATKEQIKAEIELEDLTQGLTDVEKEREKVLALCNEKAERLTEAQENLSKLQQDGTATEEELIEAERELNEARGAMNESTIEYNGEMRNANDLLSEFSDAQNTASEEILKTNESIEANKEKVNEALDYSDRLRVKCEELGGSITGTTETTDSATASVDGLADATGALSEQTEATAADVGESADELKVTYEELYNKAYESITQQIGLFEELKLDSEVSIESINKALESQQEVLSDYSENIEKAMGYAAESGSENCAAFVQAIAEMGEDGAVYMDQFVKAIEKHDGSAEKILANFAAAQDAKEKYARSMAEMEEKTQQSAEGMVDAVSGAEGQMADAASSTARAGADAAKDASSDYEQAGREQAESNASGIESGESSVRSAASGLSYAARDELQYSDAYGWGQDMGYQFAEGLASTQSYAAYVAADLAQSVADYWGHCTPKKGPLHGDDKWGLEMGEQFAEGMQSTRGIVGSAAEHLALEAADGLNHDIAAKAIQFEGTMSAMPISGMKAGSGESGKDIVVENRFYLGERDITDIITKKVINKITSIQHSKQLSKGGFGYV